MRYVLLFNIAICLLIVGVIGLECPSSSQHTNCSPKCLNDLECSSTGGKCCPNICNYKSCSIAKANSGNSGYKGSTSGAGSYCGNVKCNTYEKCDLDRTTKRQKCVRM